MTNEQLAFLIGEYARRLRALELQAEDAGKDFNTWQRLRELQFDLSNFAADLEEAKGALLGQELLVKRMDFPATPK